MIDLKKELAEALREPETRRALHEMMRDAVRAELAEQREDLLDVDAAAKICSMTPAELRKRVARGTVPCKRVGRSLRFRRSDLMKMGA